MNTVIKISKLGMVVSMIMIVHALVYPNEYSLAIVISGYILIIVSAVVYGVCIPQSKTNPTDLSETNLNLTNPTKNYRSCNDSIIPQLKLMRDNIQLRSPIGIQAHNELYALLNKPIDVDNITYGAHYVKPEDKDYATKAMVKSIIKGNTLANKGDYTEDYNSMYQ